MEDPIVNEVHATRRRIFEECGGSLKRLFERIKAGEAQYRDRLVSVEELQKREVSSNAST